MPTSRDFRRLLRLRTEIVLVIAKLGLPSSTVCLGFYFMFPFNQPKFIFGGPRLAQF